MIIGISGFAGSGKDEVAKVLRTEYSFVGVALADPLKRIARDVYDFSDDQMWGPSQMRNAPDPRYIRSRQPKHSLITRDSKTHIYCTHCREEFKVGDDTRIQESPCVTYLSPRYALQRLGTEWGRDCYPNTWVDLAIRTARELLEDKGEHFGYVPAQGVFHLGTSPSNPILGIAIPDVRFRNEFEAIRAAGGRGIRIVRPGAGLKGSYATHASEAEQMSIADDEFDYIIHNDKTLEDLAQAVRSMMQVFLG